MIASTPTVLVVEDEALVLMLLSEALEDEGFRVVTAVNGVEALRELERHDEVDVLFTDVNMPLLDGLELARRARVMRPDLPVIYASGRMAFSRSEDCVEGGRFLPKPYLPEQACAEVTSALNRSWRSVAGSC